MGLETRYESQPQYERKQSTIFPEVGIADLRVAGVVDRASKELGADLKPNARARPDAQVGPAGKAEAEP